MEEELVLPTHMVPMDDGEMRYDGGFSWGKFFIVCGAVAVTGQLMTGGGYWAYRSFMSTTWAPCVATSVAGSIICAGGLLTAAGGGIAYGVEKLKD